MAAPAGASDNCARLDRGFGGQTPGGLVAASLDGSPGWGGGGGSYDKGGGAGGSVGKPPAVSSPPHWTAAQGGSVGARLMTRSAGRRGSCRSHGPVGLDAAHPAICPSAMGPKSYGVSGPLASKSRGERQGTPRRGAVRLIDKIAAWVTVLLLVVPPLAPAQTPPPPPAGPAPAAPPPGSAASCRAAPQANPFTAEQLDQLTAPIALYPDQLVAQVLMAATYPLEVVQAARFIKDNASLKGDALNEKLKQYDWDDAVKSLVTFPQVLSMMDSKLDWTQKLGDAFLAQQKDVLDSVQRLRQRAQASGNLKSTPEQTVTVEPAPAQSST